MGFQFQTVTPADQEIIQILVKEYGFRQNRSIDLPDASAGLFYLLDLLVPLPSNFAFRLIPPGPP